MTHPSPVCSAFPPFLTGFVQVNSAGCQTVFRLLALHKNDPAFLFYGQKSLDLISRRRQNRNGKLNSKFVEITVIYWMSVQERGRKDQTVRSRTDDLSLKTRPPPTWEQPIIYVSSVTVDPNQLTKVQLSRGRDKSRDDWAWVTVLLWR